MLVVMVLACNRAMFGCLADNGNSSFCPNPLLTCHHALHHIGQGTLRCALLVPSLVARCCCECDGHRDADDSRSSLVPQHAHDRVMTDG